MKLIGICGHAGVGKDTLAHGLQFDEIMLGKTRHIYIAKFADNLKKACAAAFALHPDYFNDPKLKEQVISAWDLSPRQILQFVGTDLFREHFGQDFWIRSFQRSILTYPEDSIILITDTRFQNEVDWIVERRGIIIHVTRPGYQGNVGIPNHASEIPANFDIAKQRGVYYHVDNSSDLNHLYSYVKPLIGVIKNV